MHARLAGVDHDVAGIKQNVKIVALSVVVILAMLGATLGMNVTAIQMMKDYVVEDGKTMTVKGSDAVIETVPHSYSYDSFYPSMTDDFLRSVQDVAFSTTNNQGYGILKTHGFTRPTQDTIAFHSPEGSIVFDEEGKSTFYPTVNSQVQTTEEAFKEKHGRSLLADKCCPCQPGTLGCDDDFPMAVGRGGGYGGGGAAFARGRGGGAMMMMKMSMGSGGGANAGISQKMSMGSGGGANAGIKQQTAGQGGAM